MHIPRWFWLLVCLLGINAIFVMGTSVEKFVRGAATDDGASMESDSPGDSPNDILNAATGNSDSVAAESDLLTEKAEADGLPMLPPRHSEPPEPISEEQRQALERDPVFSEIKKMFSSDQAVEDNPPRNLNASPAMGAEHFEQLDQRLATVLDVSRAAQRLTREAAALAADGDRAAADELLDMTDQLRRMAAKLLAQ